jgi:LmbE family N-acetylglucosaminyl deacetylase
MKKILFIAPHADDETLGCGGIIHKFKSENCKIYWLLATKKKIKKKTELIKREKLIIKVKQKYKFNNLFQLSYFASDLSFKNLSTLTDDIRNIINLKKIDTIFTCYSEDTHSDHFFVSKASLSSSKIFRTPSIEKIFIYETLSESNLNFSKKAKQFKADSYFDISRFINKKISTIKLYESEFKKHPFPRSIEAIKALSLLRGSESGFKYAEAFQQIYSRIK